MRTLNVNTEYKIEVGVIDHYGDFVTGLTVYYDVRKATDNSLVISGISNEINGVYSYTYTFTEVIEYRSRFITPTGYDDGFENILVIDEPAKSTDLNIVSSGITNITSGITNITSGITNIEIELFAHRTETETRIKYILGLEQHNFRIKDQIYDINNLLTSSTIRLYNNASDTTNDVNHFKEYLMEATYDSLGKIASYKIIEA